MISKNTLTLTLTHFHFLRKFHAVMMHSDWSRELLFWARLMRAKAVGFGLVRHVTLTHFSWFFLNRLFRNQWPWNSMVFECSGKIRNRKLGTETQLFLLNRNKNRQMIFLSHCALQLKIMLCWN